MEKNRYGHILTENFQEAVGAWIKNYSNNIAIIEGERKITYRELGNLIIRCRKFFFEQGVKKGDNIAVHMGNHSEFIMVFLSLVTMGAVPILILSAQKKNEVRGIVRVATPKLYIYDAAVSVLGSLVAEGNKELKGIEKTIFTSMLESSEVEKTKEETYKEQIVPEDLALLLLSGGTTGIPKLIPRTHGDYLYNVKRITERLKLTQESVFLSVLPMAHNFALGNPGILGTLCSGGTVVICNDIAAMEIFSLIEETKVTFTAFVPSILKMCLEYRILDDGDDISSLQQVLVGGAMLPEETARQVDLVLGGKLIQVFGTAEGLICTNSMDDSYETRVSCQGQPISEYDEIKIIDSDGKEVAQGEIGELIVKGPYTIQEYYRLLDNDKYFNEEGFYLSGDKVRKLEDGNLKVVGRVKEQINRAGEKIMPMLINTSGTTGMPKTVILTWRGIMNCINATQKLFSITSKDVAFGVTNYGHDMSIFDILGMVYIGGTTVIPNQHNYKNPEIWIDLMNKYKVTVWISVPALLEMLLYSDLEKLPEVVGKLHRVIQGGDYLHIDIVKKFRKWNQKGKIFNVGGPTETTMWNIYHEVSGEDIQNNNIPYGKPFPNTQYYILDKKQELCPVGKEGQMYIAGDGVTPGYVGTGEQGKFTEYKGLRVYCSGDYGVYMRTGEILFRGRKDRQIKINGKRIELDGIEEKLNSIKGITKGAVICKDKRIVAYYVAEDKTEVNNIKKILSGILPEYMIPTAFYEIKRLPYNRNKKVDYRELERMVPKTGEQEKAETELEDFVARICENIFEVEKIGVKESFYNLGGDSVTAMRIAAIIKKEFNVHMTPYDIFEHSTIRELASYIAKLRSDINEKV